MPGRHRSPAVAVALLASAVGAFVPSLPGPAIEEPPLLGVADLDDLRAPPPDRRIAYGDDPLQFGNLRLPAGPGPYPVVLFVHGGCWLSRFDIAHTGALEQALAADGYAVWSLEYRRAGDPGGGWPATFLDVARGADHLRRLAPELRLDLSRVTAVGHSAGGQLALWLAGRPHISEESELYVPDPLPIAAVLALAPAPDLEGLYQQGVCDHVIARVMGAAPDEHPERYAAAAPAHLLPLGVPQTVLYGRRDSRWGAGGRAYCETALAAGDRVRCIEAPEAGHFEVIAPKSSTWPLVVAALHELTGR